MRAIVVKEPGDESVLELGETEAPRMGPDDLRIRVRSTAVNRADLLQRQGLYPPPPGASPIIGLECAGDVIEVGSRVRGWTAGDRAMALLAGGGYAEEVVVHAGCAMHVPESLSDEEAGATPEVFITAFLNIFLLGQPSEGGSVLVHGGGSGVGTAAISLCKEAGLKVLVTAGTEQKCERCVAHGADLAVNYRDDDFAAAVQNAADGAGVDMVLDCVGGAYLASNVKCLAPGGALVIIGLVGGRKGELDLASLLSKRLRIIGSTLRARPNEEKASIIDAFVTRFGDALNAGRIRPVIDRVLPLHRAAEGHRVLRASDHFGKVVLTVS